MTQQTNQHRQEFDSSQGQLNSESNTIIATPPVFTGFEVFKNDSEGFFIINPADGSIFKWIDITTLKRNGKFEGKKRYYQAGRRNFEGNVFNCFREVDPSRPGYVETDDAKFRECTRHFGGFYVAAYRARTNFEEIISYSGKGTAVQLVTFCEAKQNAQKYATEYAKGGEFISALPCGAAIDCVSEEIYERFEQEVLKVKLPVESMYDAWNRYEKEVRNNFRQNGIYGIHDLIFAGPEITSEAFNNINHQCAVRGGARGLFLISHYDFEKEMMDCYFEIGHRNFIASNAQFYNYGHRVVLLPQKVKLT